MVSREAGSPDVYPVNDEKQHPSPGLTVESVTSLYESSIDDDDEPDDGDVRKGQEHRGATQILGAAGEIVAFQ